MTMILKKDFTSFNHRLFVVPVFMRAISFKSSPSGELSYYIKKNPALQDSPPAAGCFQQHIPLRRSAILPGGLIIL